MCEIDITRFVRTAETFDFSASAAERGENVGAETWQNALNEARGTEYPLLNTPEHFDAMRDWARDTGAWDKAEIAAWGDDELTALFIQLISGDLRESSVDQPNGAEFGDSEFDYAVYEALQQSGTVGGNLFRSDDGRIFYCLGS